MARQIRSELILQLKTLGTGDLKKISSAFKKLEVDVGKSTRVLESKVDGVAKKIRSGLGTQLSAVLGGGAILAGLKSSLSAFDQQEKAIAQVEAGLKSTGNQIGKTIDQLKDLASQGQRTSLFGDEDILKNATAQLLTFTNIAESSFERTQQAALDLATRLDGDLKSASIQLGKALNDPAKNLSALSRSGIQFSESQIQVIKELQKTNQLAKAQSIILTELEKQYGGSAAAALAGLGPLQQLQNAFGDLQEVIGSVFAPIVNRIAIAIKTLVQEFPRLSAVVGGGSTAIGGLVLALGTLKRALIATGIGAFAVAVGTVIGEVIRLKEQTGSVSSAIQAMLINWEIALTKMLLPIENFIKNGLVSLSEGIVNAIPESIRNFLGIEAYEFDVKANTQEVETKISRLEAELGRLGVNNASQASASPSATTNPAIAQEQAITAAQKKEQDKRLADQRKFLSEIEKLKQDLALSAESNLDISATAEKIQSKYKSLLEEAKRRGFGADVITQKIDLEIDAAAENKVNKEIEDVFKRLNDTLGSSQIGGRIGQNVAQNIKNEVQAALSDIQNSAAFQEISPQNQQRILDDFEERRVEFDQKVTESADKLTDLQSLVVNDLSNGLSDAFIGAIDGAKNFGDAVSDIFNDLANRLVKQVLAQALNQLFTSLIQGASAGIGGAKTGAYIDNGSIRNLPGYATGGEVPDRSIRGPGTGTSDSILARLSNGEFVNNARTVRFFGTGFFEQLARVARGGAGVESITDKIGKKSPRFRTGGLVGNLNSFAYGLRNLDLPRFQDGGSVNTATQAGQAVAQSTVNINVQNNSSNTSVTPRSRQIDPETTVIDILVEDIRKNGRAARTLSGVFNMNRGGS